MFIIKWLATTIIGILLLLLIAVLVIPKFVDPNDYRDEITNLVKNKTGRDMELAGNLSISVFPWLGIQTQGLKFSQPPEIGGEMLSVDNAQLRLKFMPLLKKRLEIDTIVLDKPMVTMVTLKNGVSSLTGLVEEEGAEPQPSTASSQSSSSSGTTTPSQATEANAGSDVELLVQGVKVTDATLIWDDRKEGQKYTVRNLNLETGDLLSGEMAPIELLGTVIDESDPKPINIVFNGVGKVDRNDLSLSLGDSKAKVEIDGQEIDLAFTGLQFQQENGAEITGITASTDMVIPATEGDPESKPIPLEVVSTIRHLSYGMAKSNSGETELQEIKLDGRFDGLPFTVDIPKVNANIDRQVASVKTVNIVQDDIEVLVSNIAAKQIIDKPRASGELVLKPFNPRRLLKDLEIDYVPSNEQVLRSVAAKLKFDGGEKNAAFKNVEVELDQSNLKGEFAIKDFDSQAATFDLVLDQLNLDDYLPAEEESKAGEQESIEGAEALVLPLAALREINANGSFKAGRLVSSGLKLDDIDVNVVSKDGNISVTPKAKLYQGKLDGLLAFNDMRDGASLKIKNDIDLVSLGNMLTDAEITEQLTGIGSLNVDVTVTEKNGVQSNEGTIKLLAKDGTIRGMDIKGMLDNAVNTYQQFSGKTQEQVSDAETGESKTSDETGFAEVLGTFHLKDYQLSNDDFSLKAPLFRIAGEGTIDLQAQTLNYLLKVAVVESTSGQGGKALDELSGITIPIRLSGDMTSPSYSLDMKTLYQSYVKREIDKKKGEFLQEELGIEGGENLSTKEVVKEALFKSLLGGDDDKKEESSEPVPYEEIGNESSNQQAKSANTEEEPKRELTKKERREERKRKLLESIFN